MTPNEAFVGLAKRCRWRAAQIANGICRFDPDWQHLVCSLEDCPAKALGILPACVIPEWPRSTAVTATVMPKKKGKKAKQDPLESVINLVAGLTGFVPEEEE